MQRYRLDPTLTSLGKRFDSLLCDIARLPLSPPMEEVLARLHQAESRPRVTISPSHDPAVQAGPRRTPPG